jgi:hypothetical protein
VVCNEILFSELPNYSCFCKFCTVLKLFGGHFQVEKSESDGKDEKTGQACLLFYFAFKFPSIGS